MDGYYSSAERRGAGQLGRAGWRRRIGQLLRFEVALGVWEWERIDSLLDLGCGPATLADYMERTGREAEYTGVERRSSCVEYARAHHPDCEIVEGDLYEWPPDGEQYDLVVAIGAHVDGCPIDVEGRSIDRDRERAERVGRLVERCSRLAGRGAAITVLDREALRTRPVFELEPALFGIGNDELDAIRDSVDRSTATRKFLRTDRILWLDDGATYRRDRDLQEEGEGKWSAHRRAIEVHRREGGDPVEIAWLWLESGRYEAARASLEALDDRGEAGPEVRHLYDRLRRESPDE